MFRQLGVAAGAMALLLIACAGVTQARVVDVSISTTRTGPAVPSRFIGLSFEASALPSLARGATHGNLIALLRSLGPGVLRFGGLSLDGGTVFSAHPVEAPSWATTVIGPSDLDRLRTLLRRTGWRAILGIQLAHFDPRTGAREAAAASRRLRGMLAAVEIGNEPDAFVFRGQRPGDWTYEDYRAEVRAYRRAIAAMAPGVRIAGPDTNSLEWLDRFARDERPALLTPHFYPLTRCFGPLPTLERLLSAVALRRQDRIIDRVASHARRNQLPVRLGETNNVACGGQAGVSNTYGAALWALRYMVAAARAGIFGVNFHTLPDSCLGYSPICGAAHGDLPVGELTAMPEWYAMLVFRQLVGKRLLASSVSGRHSTLTAAAFASRSGRRVDVLLINTGAGSRSRLSVRLHLGARFRSRGILRLMADALGASSPTLGGTRVTRQGSWRPASRLPQAATDGEGLRVSLPAPGAMLVRLAR